MDRSTRHDPLDLAVCPECAAPAEVTWQARPDVDPDLSLAYVRCLFQHWFLMPADRVPRAA
jgi:hypothetical protein